MYLPIRTDSGQDAGFLDYYTPWKRQMETGGVVLVSIAAVITFAGQTTEYSAEEDSAQEYVLLGIAVFTAILLVVGTIGLLRRRRARFRALWPMTRISSKANSIAPKVRADVCQSGQRVPP